MAQDYRVNERIRAKEVRLVDADGKQVGIVSLREALDLADERGLDLVEVAPNAKPPVCKIMDYGKFRYQQSKKHSHRKTIDVKEVKVRPNIDKHDLELKIRNIKRFLEQGNKAKVTMFFRGREIVRPELGMQVFEKIIESLEGKYHIENKPKLQGKSMTMVISPK
ncbi:MAG: translation initiation factor IF-3 [Nitrospirae bacterium]|nr:MAG: translation initiation factor IF-3 [Nitrospirota bacterium]